MCGIAGYARLQSGSWPDDQVLAAMCDRLAHRGPDAGGAWVSPERGVALGHRRLAVVDLSPSGEQPMKSADGRWVISYNGEIYNCPELVASLEAEGNVGGWRGHSDTEVVLRALAHWGVAATLPRLDGMFAFAAFDRESGLFVLARDRFGEKPLYYAQAGGHLVFGSELKALRAFPGFDRGVDTLALAALLARGYVPAPLCIHPNARKLPAGHWLTLDLSGSKREFPEAVPYWRADDAALAAREQPFTGDFGEAVTALEQLLGDAVERRMTADVPLGALLSGGIDSSTVVALMQARRSDRVRTFSIGSDVSGYDEAGHARDVARHLGTEHTELRIGGAVARAVVPSLATMYDEPFADSSQLPTFLVSQLARRHVTVALSGDAGDEIFGGYNRYFYGPAIWRRLSRLPRMMRRLAGVAIEAVPPSTYDAFFGKVSPLAPRALRAGQAGEKLHKLARLLSARDEADFHTRLLAYWPDPGAVMTAEPRARQDLRTWAGLSFAERAMLQDTLEYLPDDVLAKVDRASMAVSLEARVPLLDSRVFEFAWRLPLSFKVGRGEGKLILRELLYRHVPRALVDRPKQGFAVPVGDWLRGPLRDWAGDLLSPVRLSADGLIDPVLVQRAWRDHQAGSANHDTRLWAVLMFQSWLEALRAESPP